MSKCSDHPDAPHGFNRSASHAEDRYVCDCEGWIPDDEEMIMSDLKRVDVDCDGTEYACDDGDYAPYQEAVSIIEQLKAEANALKTEVSELKSELNSANEYKDKLTAAVSVLVGQLKSCEVSLGAIYDVDILLGE